MKQLSRAVKYVQKDNRSRYFALCLLLGMWVMIGRHLVTVLRRGGGMFSECAQHPASVGDTASPLDHIERSPFILADVVDDNGQSFFEVYPSDPIFRKRKRVPVASSGRHTERSIIRTFEEKRDCRAVEYKSASGVGTSSTAVLRKALSSWRTEGAAEHMYRNNKREVHFTDADLNRWQHEAFYPELENGLRFPVTFDQVGIAVFTGGNFVQGRARNIHEVWLHKFKHGHLFTKFDSTDPPIVSLPEMRDEDNTRNSHWEKALGGLRWIYEGSPEVQWFFVCGCDTYIQPDYFLRALSQLDPRLPYYGGECTGRAIRGVGTEYSMGGPGYFMSRKAVELLMPLLPELITRSSMGRYRYVNDLMMGRVMLELGVLCTHIDGFYGSWPDRYAAGHYNLMLWYPLQPMPIAFHYIKKRWVMAQLHQELYFQPKLDFYMKNKDYDKAHELQEEWLNNPSCLQQEVPPP